VFENRSRYIFASKTDLPFLSTHQYHFTASKLTKVMAMRESLHNFRLSGLYGILDDICQCLTSNDDRAAITRSAHHISAVTGKGKTYLSSDLKKYMRVTEEDLKFIIQAYFGWRINNFFHVKDIAEPVLFSESVKLYSNKFLDLVTLDFEDASGDPSIACRYTVNDGFKTFSYFQLIELLTWAFSGWSPNRFFISECIGRYPNNKNDYSFYDFCLVIKKIMTSKRRSSLNGRLNRELTFFVETYLTETANNTIDKPLSFTSGR
jgi:hypothetical protein